MKRLLSAFCAMFMVFFCTSAYSLPKHWHETKGFGTGTKGGIAGEVYKVTNLNSSGKGSLKDAVSRSNRLVVFEVGGVIEGGMGIASNVTVAGQTAPSPGITLVRGNLTVRGKDIVVSHITTMMGTKVGGYPDGCNFGGTNVVLDHVAVYWGKDETVSINGTGDATMYKCLVAEPLQFSGHGDGEHSKGLFINKGPKKLSVIGTLLAHSALRNPRVDGGEVFLANHVVYNFGTGWDHKGPKPMSDDELPDCELCYDKVVSARSGANITLVGSIALHGHDSKAEFFLDGHNGSANGYLKDNIIKDREGKDLKMFNPEEITALSSPEIWPEGMEPLPAEEALYEVLRTAGPRPGDRNHHNARILKGVADGTGEIIDSEEEVGGYPKQEEPTRHSLTVPSGAKARQDWLDSWEDKIAVDTALDLSRFYGMVGTQASDKYGPPPAETKYGAGWQPGDLGIKLIQRISKRKQLHASLTLPSAAPVGVNLFDLTGNKVAYQPGRHFKAGSVEIVVNVQHLPAGLYVCSFRIGTTRINKTYHCH